MSEKYTIPDRWLNCPRKSTDLIANQFLAFKTPLSSKYNSQVPEMNRFTPQMLFDSLRSTKVSNKREVSEACVIISWCIESNLLQFQKELGLWIDLTNTSRFYDKDEVERRGCKYVKLKCRGHKETPSDDQIKYYYLFYNSFRF